MGLPQTHSQLVKEYDKGASCLLCLYMESVMREAAIHDLGYNIGGRNISNAPYAVDTAVIAVTNEDAATTRQSQCRRCAKAAETK